jgi:membrane protein
MTEYWKTLKKTFKEYSVIEAMNYSSSIAFYLIFSLPAILIITMTIAGSIYEDQVARDTLLQQFQALFGGQSAEAINKVLLNIDESYNSIIARIVGGLTLIISATTVFVSLQDGINKVWGIESKPENGWLYFLKNRLVSLAMAVSIGFLLLVTLVIDAVLSFFDEQIVAAFSETGFYIASSVNVVLSILVTTVVFACLFKIIPETEVKWKNVFSGALITTLLFIVGKYLIAFYLATSSFGDVYGAAGSLVILLTWIFYSSMIVLFGAQFTSVYSKELEGLVESTKNDKDIEE